MASGNRIRRFSRELKRQAASWHTLDTAQGEVYVPNEADGIRLPVKLSHRSKRRKPAHGS